jgi:hypothetical protein
MQQKTKKIKILLWCIIVTLSIMSAGLVWRLYPNTFNNVVRSDVSNSLLEVFQKGVEAPGALVAKVESNKAHLTILGVFTDTNQERKIEGEKPLLLDTKLNTIAKLRMNDMFEKGYFEHVSPNGESASTVADDTKYEYVTIGENIALGNFEDDAVLVKAWMDSPGHRANILRPTYTHIGIAVGKGMYQGRSTWIGVQVFSKPLSECTIIDQTLKLSIENQNQSIDTLKKQAINLEASMEQLKDEKKWEEYNQKVNEYNALAKTINDNVTNLKGDIANYNIQVRAFNDCAL